LTGSFGVGGGLVVVPALVLLLGFTSVFALRSWTVRQRLANG